MGNSVSPTVPEKKLQYIGKLYTQRELSLIFPDVPNKTLIYWAREDLVEWVAETRDARGIARLYNRWNLVQIGLVREISGLGLPIKLIRTIMYWFKDFPPGGHFDRDDEGSKVLEKCLRSEYFSSEEGSKSLLVMIKRIEDRGWQEPIIAIDRLRDEDFIKSKFGFLLNYHTTIIINPLAIQYYVDNKLKEAGLS